MLPLHFTADPLIFRVKINADVPAISADRLDCKCFNNKRIICIGTNRLPLDTVQFVSGRNDTPQFMTLKSDVATARLSGEYRYAILAKFLSNSIQPYFAVAPAVPYQCKALSSRLCCDISSSPVLAAFVPGLKSFEPIHAEGSMATGQGLNGAH
jgi:hypothetical protein